MFFLFLVFFIGIIVLVLYAHAFDKDKSQTYYDYEQYDSRRTYYKPKIGAEVSDDLHEKATSFCKKNSMTMSDLIRKSITEYMDSH